MGSDVVAIWAAIVSGVFALLSYLAARKANRIAMRSEYLEIRRRYKEITPQIRAHGTGSPLPREVIRELDQVVHDASVLDKKLHHAMKLVGDEASELSTCVRAHQTSGIPDDFAHALTHASRCDSAMDDVDKLFEQILT